MERESGRADRGAPSRARHAPRGAREQFRRQARAALEGGLIRYSKRRRLHEEARELGLSAFEAALLIADVQYGAADLAGSSSSENGRERQCKSWRRYALLWSAALLLAATWIVLRSRG